MEKGISTIDFTLGPDSEASRFAYFLVGSSLVYLHGTFDEMRAFVDAVDAAVALAEGDGNV